MVSLRDSPDDFEEGLRNPGRLLLPIYRAGSWHRLVNVYLLVINLLGKPKVLCPICGWRGHCFVHNANNRPNARCPNCGSLERHRLQKLVLDRIGFLDYCRNKRVLHFAPEAWLQESLQSTSGKYISADIVPGRAMQEADIANLHYPDRSFDVVYASHVLEHVGNDDAAIGEVFRILSSPGVAILPVPIHRQGKTVEYGLTDPLDSGHWRSPGTDYFKKFTRKAFIVKLFTSHDFDYARFGLIVHKPGFGLFIDYVPILIKPKRGRIGTVEPGLGWTLRCLER